MKTRVTLLIFNLLTTTLVAQLTYSWTKKNNFLAGKRERAVAFSIGDFGYVATGVDTAEVVHKHN